MSDYVVRIITYGVNFFTFYGCFLVVFWKILVVSVKFFTFFQAERKFSYIFLRKSNYTSKKFYSILYHHTPPIIPQSSTNHPSIHRPVHTQSTPNPHLSTTHPQNQRKTNQKSSILYKTTLQRYIIQNLNKSTQNNNNSHHFSHNGTPHRYIILTPPRKIPILTQKSP